MTGKGFKNVFSIVVAALLVIGMQLVQSGNEIPGFKFWICFVVIVSALIYIVYVSFTIAKSLMQARKQIDNLQKQLEQAGKQDIMTAKIEE